MKNIAQHSQTLVSFVKKHKKYHHYFLLSLIALSAGFFLYNKAVHVHAATYNFQQAGWGGVASTTLTASHVSNQSGWANFSSTSTEVLASGSGVSLASSNKTITDDGVASTAWATVGANPFDLAFDTAGNLYTANYGAGTVSKITPAGMVTTFATGLSAPRALAFDTSGNLYTANYTAGTVSKITPSGTVTTFATVGTSPFDLAFDTAGNLYVANNGSNSISKITPSGTNTVFAAFSYAIGPLAFDVDGNLYTARTGGTTVYKITPSGTVTTFANVGGNTFALAFDTVNNLYTVSNTVNIVNKVTPLGVVTTFATVGSSPQALAFDTAGNLYTANYGANTISKITTSGTVTTFATGVPSPRALAFDTAGNIYTVNYGVGTISKLLPTGGFESGVNSSTVVTGAGSAASVGLGYSTTTYNMGGGLRTGAFAFDSSTNSMWNANANGYYVAKVNVSTGAVISTSTTGGAAALGLSFDSFTNSIWTSTSAAYGGGVRKIRVSDGTLVSTTTLADGYGNVFDPSTNSIWVANNSINTVTKIRASDGVVISTSTVGVTPISNVVFDSSTNSIWALNGGAVANSNPSLTKIRASDSVVLGSYEIISVGNPKGIVFDPSTNSIWYGSGATVRKIRAADGVFLGAYTVNTTVTNLAFDSASNSIWVSGGTSVNNLTKLRASDGAVLGIYSVAMSNAAGINSVAFDPVTNSVWTSDYYGYNVTKISPYTSGLFSSAVIDTGALSNFTTFSASTTLNGQTITFDTRAGNATSTNDASWTAWASTTSAVANNISAYSGKRYIQYRANLSTSIPSVTPTLDNVTIGYSQYPTTGNLISSKYDTNSDANLISNITWNASNVDVDEVVKFQLRSASTSSLLDSAVWCGPTICGSGADYFTNSAGVTGGINTASSTHILSHGGDDRWFQYKTFLISGGDITPTLNSVTVQYVVNAPPEFNGVTANQISTSADANWGKTQINYVVRDVDGAGGSITPGYILPTFQYSLDGGSNWTNIASTTLTYVAASNGSLACYNNSATTSLASPAVSSSCAGNIINSIDTVATTTYRTYSVLWDAKNSTSTSVATAQVRVSISDSEAANATASATSTNFSLDTQAPTGGITFDAGISGQINSATIKISPSDAGTSSVQYLISDDSTNSVASSTGWVATTTGATTTISWTFDSDIEAKTLIYQFRDAYGNTTVATTTSTIDPIPAASFLVQDTSSVLSLPATYSMYIGWQVSTSTDFADYELEYATSTDDSNYSPYSEVAEITNVNTLYYVHGNLTKDMYYRYRLGVRDVRGNVTVRPTVYTTAHANGVQDKSEGGGGTSMTAPMMKNIAPAQGGDGKVTVSYTLTDVNKTVKTTPSYEGYIFYDNGVTIFTASSTGIVLSDASKMPASGYVQIKDEVIKYTSKTGNNLNGLTRGTWPTALTTRTTNTNATFYANTPVWIMASSTTPVLITPDTSVLTGLSGSIVWDTSKEISLAGSAYNNVGIRVLVHDNQASGSAPLTTQNISSDDGKLTTLDMTAPALSFISTTAQEDQSTASTSNSFQVSLSKAYPLDTTFTYSLSGTAVNDGVDYTMATGTVVTIPAGATTTNIFATISATSTTNISEGNKTIIVTLTSPTNATLGTNISSTYTIVKSNIHPPEFNPAGGVVINQITSGNDLGKVLISYSVRDRDALSDVNGVSNVITPSFEYSLDNGVTWLALINNLSDGSLANKTVSDVSYTATSTTFASTTDSTTALWDAATLNTYSNNLKVRVTASVTVANGAHKQSSTATTSDAIILDAQKPVVTLNLNSLNNTVTLNATDNSNISYRISNNSDLSDDGINALSQNWTDVASSSAIISPTWTFASSSIVYYSVKDIFGNTLITSNRAPEAITGLQIRDISNTTTNIFGEVLTWNPYQATTTALFGKYQIYRATTTDSSYSLLSEVSNATTISYRDNSVASSTMYYYKVLVVDADGDVSNYSNTVNDTADGLDGSSVVNVPPVITNASTTNLTSNSATITWTTNEYATSTVEYSNSRGVFTAGSVSDQNLVTSHSVTLDNLISGTDYYYQIKSTNVLDLTATDNNPDGLGAFPGYFFHTKGGPVITHMNVPLATIRDRSATVIWYTDTPSDTTLYYSASPLITTNASPAMKVGTTILASSSDAYPGLYLHQVNLSELNPSTVYYFKIVSVDAVDPTLSTSQWKENSGDYYRFTTIGDDAAPIISDVSVPVRASNSAVIVWTTSEIATSQVQWGLTASSTSDNFTTLDSFKSLNHNVSLSGLTKLTDYYFKVTSIDSSGNSTTSPTQTFKTTEDGVTIVMQIVSSTGTGNDSENDKTAPILISSDIIASSTGAFNADVQVVTNEPVRAFITYGETTSYGSNEGDNTLSTSKTISLKKLKTGTEYHYRVQVIDKAGNDVTSADATFKTKFISELLDNRTMLDKADELQGQIEQLLESALPSLSPPYVSVPVISNVTENSATVNWNTNIKTIGTLSYATDGDYASSTKNDYTLDVSTGLDKSATHTVDLVNLKPNTKYHIQARSYVFPQVMGKSTDLTFITKAAKVKADILEKKKDGFTVAWSTDEPTTSIVEYKNSKTGEINRTTDATMKTYHAVKIENIPAATSYTVKVSGTNADGNLIEAADSIDVTTSSDTTAPTISNFKVDNALVPGRTDRIQTVVGWQTDEPANSIVYYEEGAGTPGDTKELVNKVESLDTYTGNHIMILASLKPGTIYRLKVISADSSGNSKIFGPRTIITPRQTESVLDIIFKNFEDTFKFLRQ